MQTNLSLQPHPRSSRSLEALATIYSEFERELTVCEPGPETSAVLTHFNGNKSQPIHRWFPYKEGFSSQLLEWVCKTCKVDLNSISSILDPFAGVATSLLSAQLTYTANKPLR